MIKAIETIYPYPNGDRFRSRLEARWAVFFSKLGIKYDYEIEGYNFNGIRYLPDFWLSDLNCFVEVKPTLLTPSEMLKAKSLYVGKGKKVVLLQGTRFEYNPEETHNCGLDSRYMKIGVIGSQPNFFWSTIEHVCLQRAINKAAKAIELGFADSFHIFYSPLDLELPIRAARQARFEYGETPRI